LAHAFSSMRHPLAVSTQLGRVLAER
jgi:hypothetical protein